MRAQLWDGVAADEAVAMSLECILALGDDQLEHWERAEILEMVSDYVLAVSTFWRANDACRVPSRAQKVGRNQPCPCGSGKKWKKCCGAGPPQTMH